MEESYQKELQLLPSNSQSPPHRPPSSSAESFTFRYRSSSSKMVSDQQHHQFGSGPPPSLDLQLSISVRPMIHGGSSSCNNNNKSGTTGASGRGKTKTLSSAADQVEALRWQAAEQIRLAALEKAYAERVRELTRREMELAQSEFARARQLWQRATEEVENAERLKERSAGDEYSTATAAVTCMEITCQSCKQKFKPN